MRESEIHRYFTGITEQVFICELGVADPQLTDYVGGLLVRFTRSEAVYKLRSVTGQKLTAVTDMLLEAEQRLGTAQRAIYRHIGDFTLFWAGVYPEAVRRVKGTFSSDMFSDYCQHGRFAYMSASQIDTDQDTDAPRPLLETLGTNFDMVAYGLREVRREWENTAPNP